MSYEYKIGATLGGMQLLTALGIKANPLASYQPYSVIVNLQDGTTIGHGAPRITWHWSFVTIAERAVFISLLAAGEISGTVFIRSRLPDGTWKNYQAVMNLPTGEEDLQSGRILNFDVVFTFCEEQ